MNKQLLRVKYEPRHIVFIPAHDSVEAPAPPLVEFPIGAPFADLVTSYIIDPEAGQIVFNYD